METRKTSLWNEFTSLIQFDFDTDKYVFVPGIYGTPGADDFNQDTYNRICEFQFWLDELNRMKALNPVRNFTEEELDEELAKLPESQTTYNHPEYYGGEKNIYEVIKIIEHYNLSFCAGNALKYLIRAGKKMTADEIHDLNKGLWYYKREIENRKKNANKT